MYKIEMFLSVNPYSRPGVGRNGTKNIVIHWVANAGSTARGNRNYFESLKDIGTYASSQYIIGLEGEIIQCMPENEVAWHAGNYNMNYNSIGIECCHPDWNGQFNSKTYNALIELCADICRRYGLNADCIIRHYDVTGKDCPHYYVQNPAAFNQLKRDVANALGGSYTPSSEPTVEETSNGYDIYQVLYNGTNIRKGASLSSAVAYMKNSGDRVKVLAQTNGFYLLDDGNYLRVGFANKISSGNGSSATISGNNYKVLYNGTNIRSSASLNSRVAYMKNSGDIVQVVGQENGFYKLSDGKYLRIGFAEPTGTAQNVSAGTQYRINCEYPNIRSQASLSSTIVRRLAKGTIINVVGTENGFYKLSDGTYLRIGYADKV